LRAKFLAVSFSGRLFFCIFTRNIANPANTQLTMEFEGVVYRKLPEMTGTSAKGAWRKQDVVFELPSEFSRKICVTFFGDRAEDAAALNEGDAVTVSVNVESREYNGKWYTDVKAWKIVRGGGASHGGASHGGGASGSGLGRDGVSSGGVSGGVSGGGSGGSRSGSAGARQSGAAAPSFSDAPFNENTMPLPSNEVDDLPF
jgi:single-stranded DNA-binding protein